MRFLADGPTIPDEVIAAQERGELVFVCGAGVSCTAGLKTFRGLVEQVYDILGEDWNLHIAERQGMEPNGALFGQYDRVLRCLERRLISSDVRRSHAMRERIRSAVRQALAAPADIALPNHLALLELSRDSEGATRVLTTNFETLFERAWFARHSSPIATHAGPAMPQPKAAGCIGVLHLHGCLSDPDPRLGLADETALVLTSAEFGDAYLRAGWASRYIYDMARAYTLVFVGYEVNDPPMRYLLEALEADRERFLDLHKVYAFASCEPDDQDTQRALWKAKGIEPILYSKESHDHSNLYNTIQEWHRYATDPTAWRTNYLAGFLTQRPSQLAPETVTECANLLRHSDSATILTSLAPPADWLQTLSQKGVFDTATNEPGEWIASQINNPEMIRASAGLPFLSSRTRDWISRALERERGSMSQIRAQAWDIILSANREPVRGDLDEKWFSIIPRINGGETGYAIRRMISRILHPQLTAGTPIHLPGESSSPEDDEAIYDLIRFDFESKEYPSPEEILEVWPQDLGAEVSLFEALTRTLTDSLEYASDLGFLHGYDRASADVPSIASHQQNEYRTGFYPIVRTLADVWSRINSKDQKSGRQLAGLWANSRFLLTSRLWLFALESQSFKAQDAADAILHLDDEIFWRSSASVEIMRVLVGRWREFDEAHRTSLEKRLCSGVPVTLFQSDVSDNDEWRSIHDSSIFRRLKRIEGSGGTLTQDSIDLIRLIEGRHPQWKPGPRDRDDFHVWHESRVGPIGNADLLAHISDDNLVREAMRLQRERQFEQGDLWRVFCAADPDRALLGLLQEADKGEWNPTAWRDMLWAAGDKDDVPLAIAIATSIVMMPVGPTIDLLPYSTTWLMRHRHQTVNPEFPGPGFFVIWDRFADLTFRHDVLSGEDSNRDPLEAFLGSLGGTLASILLDELSARDPARGSRLGAEFSTRMARVVSCDSTSGLFGRLLLAREMAFLDWVDEEWVRENLLTRFNLEDSEAILMWRSYSQGKLCSAPLFNAIKQGMLTAIGRPELQDHESEGFASMLLAVVLEHQAGGLPEYQLTTSEMKRALGIGSPAVRRNSSWNLWHRMRAPDDQPADKPTRWRNLVGPVFRQIWPLDANLRTGEASRNLARMALECGEALPEAVEAILDYLVPYQLHELTHSFDLDRIFEQPRAVDISAIVHLVGALIDPAHPLPIDVSQFLETCVRLHPPISEDGAYIRLFGLRRGLNA